jgi:L-2-hydroxyglutarate oxidase
MTAVLSESPADSTTTDTCDFDVAVIGGGVVGLATAMHLVQHYRARVVVVEAENQLASHQTGNNSGVIHSGLYYKPGSFKAKLCAEGRDAMYRFAQERGVAHERCGKIVVALDESELAPLKTLEERGLANGLTGLRRLLPEQIKEIEPHCAGIAGLAVAETGIIDYVQVTHCYAEVVRENGGEVRKSWKVRGVSIRPDRITLHTTQGDVSARSLINCAGLQSDRIARMCGLDPEVKIVPFRGEYYKLRPEAWRLCKHLIYPVPNPAFPFLGVHFTRLIEGGVECGPNAVLALARHGYSWKRINLPDLFETLTYPGFWKMAAKYWRNGFEEMHRSLSKNAFLKALRRLMPELSGDDLIPGGAGVRAQALDRSGKLVDDFAFQNTDRMVHVLNAPSPAATASIAIGRHIAQTAERALSLIPR